MNTIQRVRGDQYQGLLHIGQIVHCGLYGGMTGYISKIDGQQMPSTIRSLGGGCCVTGGNAQITVHFERGHDSTVPEAIIRGVQWDIGPEPLNDSIIADCLIRATEIDLAHDDNVKRIKAEREAVELARAKELEELPREYHYLETVKAYEQRTGKKYCSRVCAAQNIRRELSKAFPCIKFSVRGDSFSGGDSIDIFWTDGPTTKEVDCITNKYNDHKTDHTGDFRDPTNDVFNNLYGGAKYVSTQRRMSKETEEALMSWADQQFQQETCFAKDSCGRDNLIWRLISHYSIPAGKRVTGAEHIDGVTSGFGVADFYKLTFNPDSVEQE